MSDEKFPNVILNGTKDVSLARSLKATKMKINKEVEIHT
jgi:hypothetical protein